MSTRSHVSPCGCHESTLETQPADGCLQHLRRVVGHAARFLPVQGPLGVFIHYNTLRSFQHRRFEEAVLEGADLYKAEPYLSEEAYQLERGRGRILDEDIDAVLSREPDLEILPGRLSRRELRRAMLIPGVRRVNGINISWQLEEGGWLDSFRSDLPPASAAALRVDSPQALWEACLARVKPQPPPPPVMPKRPRDVVLAQHGIDMDALIHPPLIRLTAAYLDQGIAYWPMPHRDKGLLKAARKIMPQAFAIFPAHFSGVRAEFLRQEAAGMDAEAVVLEALEQLGVPLSQWEDFVTEELLALRGWAGMVHMLEQDATLAPHDRVRCSVMELLALRLTYTVAALKDIAGDTLAWRSTPLPVPRFDPLTHVARVFDVVQLLGVSSRELAALADEEVARLVQEILASHEIERRRLLHLAYERRHERRVLIPLAKHRSMPAVVSSSNRLVAQVLFCIDEREESMRRALEEVDHAIETVGVAGFFGVAINYAGIDDAGGVSLCPVVVDPRHAVREVPVEEHEHLHLRRQDLRRLWGGVARNGFISSRTLVRGWFSTACLGFLSLFPLALRVLTPLAFGRFTRFLNRAFLPEPRTEFAFMRDDAASRDATTGLMHGFTTEELAGCVYEVLGPAGLDKGHARLVVILGHGSTSLNNPYESAYCCQACGGRTGAPNARLFALVANRPVVREALRAKGVVIPEDTWFLGGCHDTCNEDIHFFDLDLLPETHRGDLVRVHQSLDKARTLNAHERARRFEAAGRSVAPESSLRHVQERAEHIGEPRPEYGHCTNAVAFVGRREITKGLFMDRRAFLASYDATKDPGDEALAHVLHAAIPVCYSINLDYYFSAVDNDVYGSGTKLPHNINGLLGVMNGYQGDLRTGLPVQAVEIHEPVRILFIVETTPERLMKVIRADDELNEIVGNQWIRLATMDPDDGHVEVYRDGVFEKLAGDEEPLPVASSSQAWYEGKMEHLALARIEPRAA
ncbi:putative inorganic carbon transporter subunit DabA [Prosthecobacter sp.]|uniref:putative inorganic carbon transporter subunit DabA n=1 Tax=Prosthecobacter sp. TaxID=1965333 RepID=UPI003783F0A5